MASYISEILDKKVKYIQKNNDVCGILIIGSNVNKNRDILTNEATSDMDLFVVINSGPFEREITSFEGMEFDVSYISTDILKNAIETEIPSILSILAKSEIIFAEKSVLNLREQAELIFNRGPKKLSSYEVDYRRYRITEKFEQMKKSSNKLEFDILFFDLMKSIIRFYYELEKIWIPPDKRLLKFIQDSNILDIVNSILIENNQFKKIDYIEKLLINVLKSVGGRLYVWEKGLYPFDFK